MTNLPAVRGDLPDVPQKRLFWSFRQNNSGGKWQQGLPVNVIIEATSMQNAISVAKSLGIYFDGVDAGVDCPCCGDRWYEPWDGEETPKIYGMPIDYNWAENWGGRLYDGVPYSGVYYMDGRVEYRAYDGVLIVEAEFEEEENRRLLPHMRRLLPKGD